MKLGDRHNLHNESSQNENIFMCMHVDGCERILGKFFYLFMNICGVWYVSFDDCYSRRIRRSTAANLLPTRDKRNKS